MTGTKFDYYLQDELGSTMYLTGTDGLTANAYAYDDFGRRVDPYTGKLRNRLGNNNKSHAYTKNGNIIQPFAFTGYQEDEVSELNFAQERYYDPNAGRFNSEDNVRGFIEAPETLNHYEYCWGNPLSFIDQDGNWPKWIETAAKVATVAVAVVAVGAVVVGTGGVGAVVLAGAATGGVISGFANEANGGSYINGYAGGFVAGGIQSAAGSYLGPAGTIVGGSANGLGSAITDALDNIDPTVEKKKTAEQIKRDAVNNSINGMINSIPGAYMQGCTNGFNPSRYWDNGGMPPLANQTAVELAGLTDGYAAGLGQVYGNIDNLAIATGSWSNVDWYGVFTGDTGETANTSSTVEADAGC